MSHDLIWFCCPFAVRAGAAPPSVPASSVSWRTLCCMTHIILYSLCLLGWVRVAACCCGTEHIYQCLIPPTYLPYYHRHHHFPPLPFFSSYSRAYILLFTHLCCAARRHVCCVCFAFVCVVRSFALDVGLCICDVTTWRACGVAAAAAGPGRGVWFKTAALPVATRAPLSPLPTYFYIRPLRGARLQPPPQFLPLLLLTRIFLAAAAFDIRVVGGRCTCGGVVTFHVPTITYLPTR